MINTKIPGTQSVTLKKDYLEKVRIFENKQFAIISAKINPKTGHQVKKKSDTSKKTFIFFNLNKAPFRIKISHEFAEKYRIKQEIKQSQMAGESPEGLYSLVKQVEKNVVQLLGQEDINEWEGWKRIFAYEDIYAVAFNRGIRHERQRRKSKTQELNALDIIGPSDVIEISHELGISEDKLTYAVMEVIAKRKNGGKA